MVIPMAEADTLIKQSMIHDKEDADPLKHTETKETKAFKEKCRKLLTELPIVEDLGLVEDPQHNLSEISLFTDLFTQALAEKAERALSHPQFVDDGNYSETKIKRLKEPLLTITKDIVKPLEPSGESKNNPIEWAKYRHQSSLYFVARDYASRIFTGSSELNPEIEALGIKDYFYTNGTYPRDILAPRYATYKQNEIQGNGHNQGWRHRITIQREQLLSQQPTSPHS